MKSFKRSRGESEGPAHGFHAAIEFMMSSPFRSVTEASNALHEERKRAVAEMGSLAQAKQSAQAHMFLVSEAQRRMDKHDGGAEPPNIAKGRQPWGGSIAPVPSLAAPSFSSSSSSSSLLQLAPRFHGVPSDPLHAGSLDVSTSSMRTAGQVQAPHPISGHRSAASLPSRPQNVRFASGGTAGADVIAKAHRSRRDEVDEIVASAKSSIATSAATLVRAGAVEEDDAEDLNPPAPTRMTSGPSTDTHATWTYAPSTLAERSAGDTDHLRRSGGDDDGFYGSFPSGLKRNTHVTAERETSDAVWRGMDGGDKRGVEIESGAERRSHLLLLEPRPMASALNPDSDRIARRSDESRHEQGFTRGQKARGGHEEAIEGLGMGSSRGTFLIDRGAEMEMDMKSLNDELEKLKKQSSSVLANVEFDN